MGFKFVSHKLWSKKQNILRQHMHKREFWINKSGNNIKHENEAEGPWPLSLVFVFKISFTFIGQNPKIFYASVEEACSASLTIASEKQTAFKVVLS